MPSFVSTRAEMVLNGILPIDQLRDHVEPVNLLSSYIPRHVLEDNYGIMIPPPLEGEDPLRPPTSQELLNAYGCEIQYLFVEVFGVKIKSVFITYNTCFILTLQSTVDL